MTLLQTLTKRLAGRGLSVGQRLALGFLVVLLMLLAVAAIGAGGMHRVRDDMGQVMATNAQKAEHSSALLAAIGALGTKARNANLLGSGWKSAALQARVEQEARSFEATEARYAATETALEATLAAAGSDEERRLFGEIRQASAVALPLLRQAVGQALRAENALATTTLNQQADPAEQVWTARVAAFQALQKRLNDAAIARTSARVNSALAVVCGIVAAAMVAGLLVAWRITRSVTRPIGTAVRVAEQIAHGDLSSAIEPGGSDEMGRLLQAMAAMQRRLSALVNGMREAAGEVENASTEVAAGNSDLSRRVNLAAGSLQEAATSLETLASAVRHTAQSAGEADRLAASAAALAGRGGQAVAEAEATMARVRAGFETMNEIVGTIDSIAFQTNILALNAAVEAARAGDLGRGFAVVANDVRALARRCAASSKEVRSLIGQNLEQLGRGASLVTDAGKAVGESVQAVQRVAAHIAGISAASVEQSSGVESVHVSVAELEDMQSHNAALVEQGAAASESLKSQASRLTGMVGQFVLAQA